ncbi:MAG: hypothetical protein V2A72_05385, partial [Candidatus Omnitrophota bacterium]
METRMYLKDSFNRSVCMRVLHRAIVYALVFVLSFLGVPLPEMQYLPKPLYKVAKEIKDILKTPEAEAVQGKLVQYAIVNPSPTPVGSYVGTMTLGTAVDTSKSVIFTSAKNDVTRTYGKSGNAEWGGEGIQHWTTYFGDVSSVVAQRNMIDPDDAAPRSGSASAYVVEFGTAADEKIRNIAGMTVMTSNGTNSVLIKEIGLPEPVKENQSFVLVTKSVELAASANTEAATLVATLYKKNSNTPTGYVDTLKLERFAVPSGYTAFKIVHDPPHMTINYQVVELQSRAVVKSGTTSILYNSASRVVDITSTPITTLGKAFLVFNYAGGIDTNGVEGLICVRGTITNVNTLTFTRGTTGSTANQDVKIAWYLIEFTDETKVQKNTATINASSTSTTATLSPVVDLERAFAVISTSGGTTSVENWGDLSVLAQITADNTLTLSRTSSAVAVSIDWFVVELAPFTVTDPDGQETVVAGDPFPITWTTSSSSKLTTLKLQWACDGGTVWTDVVGGTAVNPQDKSYTWTVGSAAAEVDTDCKIKITNNNAGYGEAQGYVDKSDANFTMLSKLDLIAPDDGEEWVVGDTNSYITWKYWGNFTGTANQEISFWYETAPGGGWTKIADYDVDDGGKGQGVLCDYNWNPGGTGLPLLAASNQVKIKVESNTEPESGADPDILDKSAGVFTIQGSIIVTYPSGGLEGTNKWPSGVEKNIDWDLNCAASGTVDILYSLIGNDPDRYNWEVISEGVVTADDTPYPFTMPLDGTPTTNAFIWVCKTLDETTGGKAKFELTRSIGITQHNGGSTLRVGDNNADTKIVWSLGGDPASSMLKIFYCDDYSGSKTWVPFPNNGTGYTASLLETAWTVPTIENSEDCKIRIEDFTDSSIYRESEDTFSIKAKLNIYQPAAAAIIDSSVATNYIKWTIDGILSDADTYKIFYSTDGTSYGSTPIATAPADFLINDKQFLWTTPTTTNLDDDDSKLKIVKEGDDSETTGTVGFSGLFTIRGSLTDLKIDGQPGGDIYNYGDTISFTWVAYPATQGDLGTVELRYSTNSGGDYNTIFHTCDAYLQAFDWNIDDNSIICDTVRFQVRLSTDSTALVRANTTPDTKVFSKIAMVIPSMNPADPLLTWEVGGETNPTIQWSYVGTMTTVNLKYSLDGNPEHASNPLASGLDADEPYAWPMPTDDTLFKELDYGKNEDILIRVEDADYPGYVKAVSQQPLTIKSRIAGVTLSATTIYTGTPFQPIDWTTYGDVPSINIYYSIDGAGGPFDNEVIAPTPNADGYDVWPKVTCPLSAPLGVDTYDVYFKVESAAHPSDISGISDEVIVKGKLEITAPTTANQGVSSLISTHTFKIEWIVNNDVGNTGDYDMGTLNLRYAQNGSSYGSPFYTPSCSGNNYYVWPSVPEPISGTLPLLYPQIKIEDADNTADVNDESGTFHIRGALYKTAVSDHQMICPNGGEPYEVDIDTIPISWKFKGNIGTVAIKYNMDGGNYSTLDTPLYNVGDTTGGLAIYLYTPPHDLGMNVADTNYRVRVEATTGSEADYVYAGSLSDFILKGGITLSSPGCGGVGNEEKWFISSAQSIVFDVTGGIPQVDIWLDTDGVLDFDEFLIADDFATTNGENIYPWAVPSLSDAEKKTITSDDCWVRVKFDATTYSDSSNNFYIKPIFQSGLTEIESDTLWTVATNSEQFSWVTKGKVDYVRLKNSPDGSSWYNRNVIANPSSGSGSYIWSIPTDNTVGINSSLIKLVKVTGTDPDWVEDTDVVITSPATFSIKGKINIITPTSATTYNVLDTAQIRWSADGDVGTVGIWYNVTPGYPDGGWDFVKDQGGINDATGIPADYCTNPPDTYYTFTIPAQVASAKFKVAEDEFPLVVYGISPTTGTHTILGNILFDQPPGDPDTKGETIELGPGIDHTIHWSLVGEFTSGLRAYWKKVGESESQWHQIGSDLAGDVTQIDIDFPNDSNPTNPITNAAGTNKVLFKVLDIGQIETYAQTPTNEGNAITAYLDWVGPTVPAEFTVGQTYTADTQKVAWLKYGDIGNLKFELYYNGQYINSGTNLSNSHDSGGSGTTNYHNPNWQIPDKIYNACKIKVSTTDAAYPILSSEHDTGTFKIKGNLASDAIVTPNASTTWYVGDTQTITWDAVGSMYSVEIKIYIPGSGWIPIDSNYTNGGQGLNYGTNNYYWVYTGATLQDQKTYQCQIRIISNQNTEILSDSLQFTFKPRITVSNFASDQIAGASPIVNWTYTGTKTTQVNIQVDLNGDLNWSDAVNIDPDVEVDENQPYTCINTFPATLAPAARLRVIDNSTSYVYGYTSAPFKIKGQIDISKPDATCTNWKVGDTNRNIEFNVKGNIGDVKIYADYDGNGTKDQELHTMTTAPGYNSWTWEDPTSEVGIGDHVGINCKIIIEDLDVPGDAADTSDPFYIIGGFTFTKPVTTPKETHKIDDDTVPLNPTGYVIKWKTTGTNITAVKLEYWNKDDNGGAGAWRTIKADVANDYYGENENTYTWDADNTPPQDNGLPVNLAATNVKFKITASSPVQSATALESPEIVLCGKVIFDTGDTPNSSSIWTVGITNTISWHVYGPMATVKLTYNNGAGYLETPIISSTTADSGTPGDNQGSYDWKIPVDPSVDAYICEPEDNEYSKIKVEDTSLGQYTYHESQPYIVKGVLRLIAPNVSSGLFCGTLYTITWERDGRINAVNVKYATDGSTYSNPIESNRAFATNSATQQSTTEQWPCPETPVTTTYSLLVEDAKYEKAGSAGTFIPSAPFKVKGDFTLTKPDVSNEWQATTTHTIEWDVEHGNIAKVRIIASPSGAFGADEYSVATNIDAFDVAGGGGFNPVGDPVGFGKYDWCIPYTAPLTSDTTTKFKVRHNDVTNFPEVISDAADCPGMRIVGKITVSTPTGDDWVKGDTDKQVNFRTYGSNMGTVWIYLYDTSSEHMLCTVNGVATNGNGNEETFSGFTVPDAKNHNCIIRVRDAQSSPGAEGECTGVFSCYPVISNIAITPTNPPNVADVWIAGSTGQILTWSVNGSNKIDAVDIYYSETGESGFNFETDTPVKNGWTTSEVCDTITVPTARTIHGVFAVRDDNSNFDDYVNEIGTEFRICGKIDISEPDDTHTWNIGATDKLIKWSYDGDISTVDIDVNYGRVGDTWQELVNGVLATDGTAGYNPYPVVVGGVPDKASNGVQFRIFDTNTDYNDVTTTDSEPFAITGSFTFVAPDPVFKVETNTPSMDIKWFTIGN